MLIHFFLTLREERLPVSLTEWFSLLECLQKNLIFGKVDDFYWLARTCLVKDEKNFDKFDRAFTRYFEKSDRVGAPDLVEIPRDWLRRQFEAVLSEAEKAQIEALGGLEKLLETFRQRLQEQRERHQGGNRWIGTGGTSPFGAFGYHPQGIRIGQETGRNRRAVKVWEQRHYRDLDDTVELGTRNLKLALRRLRRFARSGAEQELDLDHTISSTARKGGLLDLRLVPERRNAVKVLLFFDVGGSMDTHVRRCEELFSAARTEFKHLRYFYFHNFLYESVWTQSRRRHAETTPTWDILHRYSRDYKVILVGDATMAPYEITQPGGSIEHYNEEAGAVWMQRLTDTFEHLVWLNPTPQEYWEHGYSIGMVQQLLSDRMYPLTVKGLEDAMTRLTR